MQKLAYDLGLRGDGAVVDQVLEYCMGQVAGWADEDGVATLAELEGVACRRLCLEFEEIWSDDDIERLVRKYAEQGEYAFAYIRTAFDGETFGTTLIRDDVAPGVKSYIAFIDCRGPKAHRRYFTRWHEIAHLLTLPPRSGEPVNRSPLGRCPVEQLMDKIAAEVGFFDPIFRPALEGYLASGSLGFQVVEQIRRDHCPTASFQSTLIACVRQAPVPAVYVEAAMGYKKDEATKVFSPQRTLFPVELPEARLRIQNATGNDEARRLRLRFDRNMEVPGTSVLARLFGGEVDRGSSTDLAGHEALSNWEHSDGSTLSDATVFIEARRLPSQVFGLVVPC
ncbi:hypothetical protein [Paludisphaera mucosa]|uniref:IrrE N-terminal-like domain-containing protein n=1 Tax=Paludisphaera mucosa TaxID=3030827 RepID=A0ABT6FLD9_9BACT|nr:hypothetical protein [Paludisphaera mucosa]MDG3008393.1 hypothetical protein [Paludisphaera mucosa]